MKVKFRCFPEIEAVLPKPYLAKRGMPEWLKRMPLSLFSHDIGEEVKTVKACPPVVDAMTSGFLLPLACDLKVDKGSFEWDWSDLPPNLPPHVARSPIHFHIGEQVAGSPLAGLGWVPIKFRNLWSIEPDEGWSILYTHPFNRLDLPYRTVTGLVDNDRYHDVFTHIPAVWTDPDFVGVLPRGTPIAQCIPVRRDTLDLEISAMTPDELGTFLEATGSINENPGEYKRLYRVAR
ncbi:MAG: hypothetical protein ACREDZ_17415 [Kiloniellales bacterium]